MDLRIAIQPQIGASHATLRTVAQATRDAGFSALFRADHLLAMGPGNGLPGPTESFVSIAALAAEVPGLRFGTLVAAATFRHPSMVAIAAASIDDSSGGRLELGIGTGWFEAEHVAYGIDFPATAGERFDRLTEQLEIITGLWATPVGETFSYEGRYFVLRNAPGLPKPVQVVDGLPRVPIIVGGHGPTRTPRLAARFANEFNIVNADLSATAAQAARVRLACEAIGRDPGTLTYSAANAVCTGTTSSAIARRAERLGRSVDDLTATAYAGSPERVIDTLGRWWDAGIRRVYLQVLDLTDLDHIAMIGERVLPAVSRFGSAPRSFA